MSSRLLALPLILAAIAAAPPAATTAPATRPATSRRVVLDPVQQEFSEKLKAYGQLVPQDGILRDPAQRAKVAPEALPVLRRALQLEQAILARKPSLATSYDSLEVKYLAAIIVMGGDTADLKPSADHLARAGLLAEYITGDPARQAEIANKAVADLRADLTSHEAFLGAVVLKHAGGASSPELTKSLDDALTDCIAALRAKEAAIAKAAKDKTMAALNKPMVLEGKTPDGKDFSSASLRGKVVMVDFWATWCGPCKASLPHLKELYKTYHDKGLEVVAVSNDYSVEPLKKFVAADPGMPWTQLFDPAAAAEQKWHPITEKYGINGIPAMFLIDRNGVCRSVTARAELDKLIPALLAEQAAAK